MGIPKLFYPRLKASIFSEVRVLAAEEFPRVSEDDMS